MYSGGFEGGEVGPVPVHERRVDLFLDNLTLGSIRVDHRHPVTLGREGPRQVTADFTGTHNDKAFVLHVDRLWLNILVLSTAPERFDWAASMGPLQLGLVELPATV